MASGRHLLAELDRGLHTSRDEFRALDIELQASSAALARNQRRQVSVYQRLAKQRLTELDNELFEADLTAADDEARRLLEQRAGALSALHQSISDSETRIDELNTTEHAAQERLDDAEAALNTLLLSVDEQLARDPAFQERTHAAQQAIDTAGNAAAKTAEAEARREQKRKPYDDDPLFSYLWGERYGTSDYRAGLIQRFFDGLIARHIRYEPARQNFHTLNEIPRRLAAHAARLEAEAADLNEALADFEAAADTDAGAEPLQAAVEKARSRLRDAGEAASLEQQRCATLIQQRETYALGQDDYFVKAMRLLAEQMRAEPVPQLERAAAATPGYDDDELVDELRSLREEQARLQHYLEDHRDLHQRRAERVNELAALRRRFRDRDFDASNSVIDDHGKVAMMLGEFLRGVISSERLWRSIRHAQRFKRSRIPHHQRQRAGAGVRLPRMPRSVRMPRSGGFGGGGGFRTKGGF